MTLIIQHLPCEHLLIIIIVIVIIIIIIIIIIMEQEYEYHFVSCIIAFSPSHYEQTLVLLLYVYTTWVAISLCIWACFLM